MSAETAAAIAITGLSGMFLWFSSQDYMRTKHEAISILFMFLGLLFAVVDVYVASEFLRVQIDADLGGLLMTLVQVLFWVFVIFLLYVMLMFTSHWFKRMSRAHDGFSKEDLDG